MTKPSPTLLAAIAVVGAAGFLIGRQSAPQPDAAALSPAGTARGAEVSNSRDSSSGPLRTGQRMAGRHSEVGSTAGATRYQGAAALARMEDIVRGEDPIARSRALLALIDQMDAGDLESMVARFRSLGITEDRFGEYGMLLTAWAKADPLKALEYVRGNTSGTFATNAVLAAWANQDPEGAVSWAHANHSGDGPNPLMPAIIRSIAATDLPRASQLLTEMPRSGERGEALAGFLGHLLQSGSEHTKNWAANLTDESLKAAALNRVAGQLAATDPAGTARWLLATAPDQRGNGMGTVINQWAQNNPSEATNFVNSLPSGEVRGEAFRSLVSTVTAQNPQAGAALLDRFPRDLDNGALRGFVWHSLEKEPALALSYISKLPNPQDQERFYNRSLRVWLDRDANAAQAWIARNNLPQSVIQNLNNNNNQNR